MARRHTPCFAYAVNDSPERLRLRWRLGKGPGSADLIWQSGGDEVIAHASYLGDGLSWVLQAVLDLANGSSTSFAMLDGEPGGWLLLFSSNGENVNVQFVQFAVLMHGDDSWRGGRPVWAGRVELRALVAATNAMLEDVLHDLSRDQYERSWGFPFPDGLATALAQHTN